MKLKFTVTAFFTVILILFFSGCKEPSDPDAFETTSITVSGVPKTIPAFSGSPAAPTFKVYIYATDEVTNQKKPKAKGVTRISDTAKVIDNGDTYTVTIDLGQIHSNFKEGRPGHNPALPEYDPNPNPWYGAWSGTAKVFTLVISPEDTLEYGRFSIWMRGGFDLNIDKKNMVWSELMNFRLRQTGQAIGQNFALNEWQFYHDNICWDPEITTHTSSLVPPHRCPLDTREEMYNE